MKLDVGVVPEVLCIFVTVVSVVRIDPTWSVLVLLAVSFSSGTSAFAELENVT